MSDSLRPVDCSPPSSSVHGILQARILEWVAISSPGDLPNPGIEPRSLTFQADALISAPPGKSLNTRIKDFKGGKEARLKEEGGGGGRGRPKGVALQMSPATYRYPGIMGLFPGPPEKEGLELGPTRNQTRPEPEFKFSAKRR